MIPSRIYKAASCWNLDFDGTDDAVDTGLKTQFHSLTQMSFLGWLRPDIVNRDYMPIFSNREASGTFKGIWMMASDGTSKNKISVNAVSAFLSGYGTSNNVILEANTWVHLAFIYNGGGATNADKLKLYKNGAAEAITFSGTVTGTLLNPDYNMRLGFKATTSTYWDGRMSNISFWNRALTEKEIKYWMPRYLTGRETGLIAYYPFLDATGSTLKDWSNNKINGTISGATWTKGS